MPGRGSRGLLFALLLIGSLLGMAHSTAPAARAECDGGLVFSAVAPMSDATIVGRVTEVARHANGFVDVLGVRVERAYRITTGPTYTARFKTAWCADNVRVGSRVVLLIGMHDPSLPMLHGDYYFVVGQSVTAAEAAAVGGVLPDTSTAVLNDDRSSTPWWVILGAGGLAFAAGLRRGGARPGTLPPRRRAA